MKSAKNAQSQQKCVNDYYIFVVVKFRLMLLIKL